MYGTISRRPTTGCDALELGLIAQRPFLAVILIFRVPEAFAHDDTSERSQLAETLEGTLPSTPQAMQ